MGHTEGVVHATACVPLKGGRHTWPFVLCASLLAALILWPGRASLPPIDRDESRYAQATRQMLETGDFLDPRFQDHPRYVQPAGVYWAQAAAVSLLSDATRRVIWPHRVPSWLAGIVSAALTCAIGARLLGPAAGLAGATLLASSLLFGFEARIATTDATLLAFVLLAQWALLAIWQAREGPDTSRVHSAVLWAALGCSIMVKGPIGLVWLGLTALGLSASGGTWRWLRRLHPLSGVALMAAIVLPWMIAIAIRTDGAFFAQALGHNLLGKLSHGQESHWAPPGYYLAIFAAMFWPGSLLAFRAVPAVWRARSMPGVQFLLCWVIPAWLLFELVPTKLPQYVLPAYPGIALLCVSVLPAGPGGGWQRWAFATARMIWVVVGLVLVVGGPLLLWRYSNGVRPVVWLAAAAEVAFLAIMAQMARRARTQLAVACGLLASAIFQAATFGMVLPGLTPIWISPRVAALVAASSRCQRPTLASASYSEPSLVFLLGTQTRLVDPVTAAEHIVRDPACTLALVDVAGLPPFLAVLAAHHMAVEDRGTVTGRDYSNNHFLTLHLFSAVPP
ncbi:ArnT family glycosyltransferase [Acidisphaera rubrifaciens]|uniref:Glycosyl transferase n=1 Tax=Acidisphaera rubrifaciens HS-AP3 TaxID=1231350 RepID=A0A0D6P585_9PROT|nr:glycosyltransferase family 39 protein [Acidisphaera rubrifaciens]GAN76049.1 glycosyl transferase [Acidisphaera rubrifaciens HS-AP3]